MRQFSEGGGRHASVLRGLVAAVWIGATIGTTGAQADETQAKALFKAMSDYLAAQKQISFDFDSTFEVVTTEDQRLALASSGTVALERPGKLLATRTGGFSSVEAAFNGETLTLVGKDAGVYAEAKIPGSIDHLIEELRNTYHYPLPAADLLLSNVNDELMPLVTDVKDLGSGVIRGEECDHLAFRTDDVDWQIWIAQGAAPYPCRYVITAKKVAGGPQYTVDVRDWKTGKDAANDFDVKLPEGAKLVQANGIPDFDELGSLYILKGAE